MQWLPGVRADKEELSIAPLLFALREYECEWLCFEWRWLLCSLCLSLPGRAPPCSELLWRSDETLIRILSSSLVAEPFSAYEAARRGFLELGFSFLSPGWLACCG